MTIDPETIRKGDMLMSPEKQLYSVTEAMKIDLQFAFADKITRDAALVEGWNPVVDDGKRVTYYFSLTSLDGQLRATLLASPGQPIHSEWEIIAKVPTSDEATT